jgi:hypothetical protein
MIYLIMGSISLLIGFLFFRKRDLKNKANRRQTALRIDTIPEDLLAEIRRLQTPKLASKSPLHKEFRLYRISGG